MQLLCQAEHRVSATELYVFELYLLVDVATQPHVSLRPDATLQHRESTFYLYKRTGADALLHWLHRYHIRFGIWTYETRRLARRIFKALFPTSSTQCFFSRRSCDTFEGVFIKNTTRLKRRCMLIDFNPTQLVYAAKLGLKQTFLVDTTRNLVKITRFLKRRAPTYHVVPLVRNASCPPNSPVSI